MESGCWMIGSTSIEAKAAKFGMASLGNPRTWVPYVNNKDCSCSLYCPQWCYIVYPPPPPPTFEFPQDHNDSTPNFSPLVIAIIGILVSASLLVSYYTFISKYCGKTHSSDDEIQDNHNPSLHEPWRFSTNGLDEALIKSITVYKYKKAEGLVGVTDCSVSVSLKKMRALDYWPNVATLFIFLVLINGSNLTPIALYVVLIYSPSMPPPELEQEAPSVEEGAKPALRAFSDLGFMPGRHRMIEMAKKASEGRCLWIIRFKLGKWKNAAMKQVHQRDVEEEKAVSLALCIIYGVAEAEGASNREESE